MCAASWTGLCTALSCRTNPPTNPTTITGAFPEVTFSLGSSEAREKHVAFWVGTATSPGHSKIGIKLKTLTFPTMHQATEIICESSNQQVTPSCKVPATPRATLLGAKKSRVSLGGTHLEKPCLNSNQLKISQSGNAHVDRYELAFFLAIRHVGVGPNLQFAINRRILVDLESHRPLRRLLKLIAFVGHRMVRSNSQGKRGLLNLSDFAGNGLRGCLLMCCSRTVGECGGECAYNCHKNQAGHGGPDNLQFFLHFWSLRKVFDWFSQNCRWTSTYIGKNHKSA